MSEEAWAVMEGRSRSSIEAILEAYGSHQRAVRLEMERRAVEREAFLVDFQVKARSIIRPVMEQVGELLIRAGHEFDIVEKEAAAQARRAANAVITLVIFPEGERPRTDEPVGWPHVAFLAHPSKNTVIVHESAMMPGVGGPAGTAAEYFLDTVTPEIVERHIVDVLARAMGIGKARRSSARFRRRYPEPEVELPLGPELHVPRTATPDERIGAAFEYLASPLDGKS
jgi:hypothetical protein